MILRPPLAARRMATPEWRKRKRPFSFLKGLFLFLATPAIKVWGWAVTVVAAQTHRYVSISVAVAFACPQAFARHLQAWRSCHPALAGVASALDDPAFHSRRFQ